jgi:hypothetical protein
MIKMPIDLVLSLQP